VIVGSRVSKTPVARTKITVLKVKGENKSPSAITVPRSFTKHEPRIPFPNSVLLRPVSSITAYTTAIEVVDSAIPANQLASEFHPNP
jgi:hypothetical protein